MAEPADKRLVTEDQRSLAFVSQFLLISGLVWNRHSDISVPRTCAMYTGWCPLAKHVPPYGTHRPTFQKIDEFPQMQFWDKLMTSVVIQRLVPGRDSADNCESLWKFRRCSSWISLTRSLSMPSTRWSMSLLCCAMGVPQVHSIDGCTSL